MTIVLKPHAFYDVFVSLIHGLELLTLRRLLGVVAKQETRIIATLLKKGNTIIPLEAVEVYSMQYARILPYGQMITAANVALFIMYAQVFNEAFNHMQAVRDVEEQKELKQYIINIFEEMCSRFLDDTLCEDKNRFCRSKSGETCHSLSASCTIRVLLSLVNCKVKMHNNNTTRVGDEVFICIQRYMGIVSAAALHEDPYSAGFTTPTKLLLYKRNREQGGILQDLLTPFEVQSQLNVSPQPFESPHRGLCLNDDMQTLLKFIIHAIMELRSCKRNFMDANEDENLFSAFVRNACGIKLSDPCRQVLWGRVHSICFHDYGVHERDALVMELEPMILEQKANTISIPHF